MRICEKKCISLLGRILTPGCKHFGMKPISSYIYKSIKACDIWYCMLLVIVNLYGIIELVFILVGVVSLTYGNWKPVIHQGHSRSEGEVRHRRIITETHCDMVIRGVWENHAHLRNLNHKTLPLQLVSRTALCARKKTPATQPWLMDKMLLKGA